MASDDSKKALSRHMSIGLNPSAQPSGTSKTKAPTPTTIRNAEEGHSSFLHRRRQTVDSIEILDWKLDKGPSLHVPPSASKTEQPSLCADAGQDDEKEQTKKANGEERKPRLFVVEKWLYFGSEETPGGEGVEGEGQPSPTVVEQRRLADTTPISDLHRQVIQSTWPIIADQMSSHGCQIFLRIFEISQGIKRVFGFGPEMSSAEIVSHPRLVRHASRFMEAMQSAVEHMDELDTVVSPVFINLGKRHIYFKDISEDYFNVFSGAILYTWRQALGERFSAEVRSAWSRLFDFIIQHLRFGYELEMADNESIVVTRDYGLDGTELKETENN